MLDALTSALRDLLDGTDMPALVSGANVSFDRPSDAYNPQTTTINLFLYDIRENADLRRHEAVIERQGATVTMHRPPVRIACSYLVTAWIGADATGEEAILKQHELLGAVLRLFSSMSTIPQRLLQGDLASQPYLVPLVIPQGELMKNPAEFWSAIGGKLRPSFTLTATIALELDATPVTAHQVVTKKIDLHGTEAIFQIGGTVRAAAGGTSVDAVELTLRELGLQARSNAAGQFSFAGVPEGSYELQARKQGYADTSRQVRVPGASPTAFDLQLST